MCHNPSAGGIEGLIRLEIPEKPPKLASGRWKGFIQTAVLSIMARAKISSGVGRGRGDKR